MMEREGGRGGGGGRPDSPPMNRRMPSPDMRDRDRDVHDRDMGRGYFPADGAGRGGMHGGGPRRGADFDRGGAREFSPRYMGEICVHISVCVCNVCACGGVLPCQETLCMEPSKRTDGRWELTCGAWAQVRAALLRGVEGT